MPEPTQQMFRLQIAEQITKNPCTLSAPGHPQLELTIID